MTFLRRHGIDRPAWRPTCSSRSSSTSVVAPPSRRPGRLLGPRRSWSGPLQLAKVLADGRGWPTGPPATSTADVLADHVADPAARRLLHAVVRLTTYAPMRPSSRLTPAFGRWRSVSTPACATCTVAGRPGSTGWPTWRSTRV